MNKYTNSMRTWMARPAVRGGLQSCFGMMLALAVMSAPPVWYALSEEQVSVGPVYALVTYNVVLQSTVGAALFFMIQRLASGVVGSALGVAIMYITYASNGLEYSSSVTKGVVICICMTIISGVLVYFQMVMPRFAFGFVVIQIAMSVVALTGYHDPFQPLAMPYFLLQIVLGVSFAFLASLFFFPILAGKIVEKKTIDCIQKLGKGTEYLVKEILLETSDADPTIDPQMSRADRISLFYESFALKASQDLVSAKDLVQNVVATEVHVYGKPHLFPRQEYATLLSLLRHFLSIQMTTLYFIEDRNYRLQDKELFGPFLLPLAEKITETSMCLVSIIERRVTYTSSMGCLENLERSLLAVSQHVTDEIRSQHMMGMALDPALLLNIFVMGVRIRRCFLIVPALLEARGDAEAKEAWHLCHQYFQGKHFHLRDVVSDIEDDAWMRLSLSSYSSMRSDEFLNRMGSGISVLSDQSATDFIVRKDSFKHPDSPKLFKKARILLEKLHIHPKFLKSAMQQMVSVLIGTIIHVCDASYNALGGRTIWIIFTIVVVGAQGSYGNLLLKGFNRLIGTMAGGAFGLLAIYFVYLINGLSYANTPLKFIMMAIIVSVINGCFMAGGIRSSVQFYYAWVVMKITFPIVVFVGYLNTHPEPESVGYRLLSVVIGFAIELCVSAVIFPRTTSSDARHRIQDCLQKFAVLSQTISSSLLHTEIDNEHELPYAVAVHIDEPKMKKEKSSAAIHAALGGLVIKLSPLGTEIAHLIESLTNFESLLSFEKKMMKGLPISLFKLSSRSSKKIPPDHVRTTKRLFRRLLNEFLTLAYLKDSMEVDKIVTLSLFHKQVKEILCNTLPICLSCLSLSLGLHSTRESVKREVLLSTLKNQVSTLTQDATKQLESVDPSGPDFEDQIITCAALNILASIGTCIQSLSDAL